MKSKTLPILNAANLSAKDLDLLGIERPIPISNSKRAEIVNNQSVKMDTKKVLTKSAAASALALGLILSNGFVEQSSAALPTVQNQFMVGKQIPQNILNSPNTHVNYEGGGSGAMIQSGFVIQPYIIPTLDPKEIEEKGNNIYVGGIKFLRCTINPNANFKSNGSLDRPYLKTPLKVTIPTPVTQMFATHTLPEEISNIVKADWNLGPIKEAGGNPNALASYDGVGHYVFKVAEQTLGVLNSGTDEKIFYLETPNSIKYKNFLTDLNTLYKFNKTSAVFLGDSNTEFIKEFLKRDDQAHHLLQLQTNVGRVVLGTSVVYNVLGEQITVTLPNEFVHKLISPNQWLKNYIPKGISFDDMFCIYKGEEFKYQRINYVPGYGDGTKEFPFQINKNRPIWSGTGYYAFTDVNPFPMPRSFEIMPIVHIMSMDRLSNKKELKNMYRKVYKNILTGHNSDSKENFEFYGVMIDNYKFIYGGRANIQGSGKFSTINYQDGSILHPYINDKFTKKGHYKIKGVVTPIVNSNAQYNKFMNIISTNAFLRTFSLELLSPNYAIGMTNGDAPSTISKLKNQQVQSMAHRMHGRIIYDKYGRPIAIISKYAQISIFEPPISNTIPRKNTKISDNTQDKQYDKIINGVKFDIVNDNKDADERTGTFKNPFLANEGPRGVAYYQIGGTNLMTPIPVDGFKLKPWFNALDKKEGGNFIVSKLPYENGATVYEEKIGTYEVYRYNRAYTYDFGTITQPYILDRNGAFNFTQGTPSFFRIKGPDERYYVNAKPISTVKGIEAFYSAITKEKLSPTFHTKGKIYTIEANGSIVEINSFLRR